VWVLVLLPVQEAMVQQQQQQQQEGLAAVTGLFQG
jgi:hypothetical protein